MYKPQQRKVRYMKKEGNVTPTKEINSSNEDDVH
jgi:hypothetical protein